MKHLSQFASVAALVVGSSIALLTGAQAATVGTTSLPAASTSGPISSASVPGIFALNFDENGHVSCSIGTCSASVGPDPTHLVSGNVLIYTLPNAVGSGDVGINNASGQLSDDLRFTAGDLMIFYSFDDLGSLADVELPAGFNPPILSTENPDGSFVFLAGGGGNNVYNGMSDVVPSEIPLPPTIYLFSSVLGGAFWLGRRRRSAVSGLGSA